MQLNEQQQLEQTVRQNPQLAKILKMRTQYSALKNRDVMSNPQMAEGGYMMERFAQNQQQDMVGGYVPPPKQSFANGGLQVGTQAVVYGPDGQQYGNSMIAERAGVTDYGYTQPSTVEQFPIADFQPLKKGMEQQVPGFPSTAVYDPTPTPTVPSPIASYSPDATIGDISAQMVTAPGLPQGAEIQTVSTTPTSDQMLGAGTGQVSGQVALPTAQAGSATRK